MFAKKGPLTPVIGNGAQHLLLYGSDTFEKTSKYYNHATRFAVGILGQANNCMIQRVVPDDAGPEANMVIYIDVLADDIPNYKRNSDGSYVLDPTTGDPVVDDDNPTVTGYRVKYIKKFFTDGADLGTRTMLPGTMQKTDSDGNVVATSNMYPILELKAKYKGEYYNNIGIAIESLASEDIDTRITTATKSLPYKLALYNRKDSKSKPELFKSLYGEKSVMFTLKRNAINPLTDAIFDMEFVFDNNWYNETNRTLSLRYEEYEGLYVYDSNIETVLKMFMANEKSYISSTPATWEDGNEASTLSWFDFTTDDQTELDNEFLLFNLFTGKSSKNVNYFTWILDNSTPNLHENESEIRLTKNTPVFLSGGSDGTINNINYETLVVREMKKYLDPDSEVQDTAINVESVLYDSGFTLDTKKELANFIGVRKDTAVVLSTHDASLGTKYLPLSDERAIAVALKTRLQMMPESDYFGTGVARALIVAGTGLMADGSSKDRIPLSYEIAIKSARYMGAGNGKWNAAYMFDRAPGNIIEKLKDIQPSFIPAGVKPALWSAGMVWAQPYDRRSFHFAGIQTVYENDTSVLNSWPTVMAICTLTKIAHQAWRNFTGESDLTEGELADAVVSFVNEAVKDKFAGRFIIIPEVEFTEADELRGYSWRLITKIGANNMKTVMVHITESYRMADLAQG